ncbi:hypothetical protein CL656_02010 [bacterium]|nr:hypothetical protein [bacterium]|tara:strand:- start:247 stop:2097 length:1851 start_codon:yes stop_codon:yes gene_type:complete
MYFFDSKVEFFTSNNNQEISEKTYIEGYELDLSDENFNAEVLFLIKIQNLDMEKASEFSDLLVDNFRIELLKLLQKDPYAGFESGLRKVNTFYEEFFDGTDLKEEDLPKIDVGAILLVNNKIFFTKRGDIDMYLLRTGQINQISDALVDASQDEFFSNVASGEFQVGDHFIISSDRILRYISFNDFLKYSRNIDTFKEGLLETLNPNLEHLVGIMSSYISELKETNDSEDSITNTGSKFSIKNLNLSAHSSRIFLIFITLLLIIVLISGLVFTFNKNVKTQEGIDVATEIQNIKNTIINAKSEVSLDRAFYTLNLANDKINKLESLNQKSKVLNDLKDEIQEVMLTLDNVSVIDEPLEIFDMESLNPSHEIKTMFLSGGDLMVASNKSLYQNLASTQSQKILGFDENFNPRVKTFSADYESIIYLDNENKLKELNISGIRSLNVSNEFSDSIVDIFAYGKRLYFLDNQDKNIFKLQRVNNGYYSKSNYFTQSQDFLESATQIAIDGAVYAFTDKFQFNKYFKGDIDSSFVLQNQPYVKIESLKDVFADFDHSFIYALDSKSNKIFRYYKDVESNILDYNKVYSFPNIDNVENFIVDYNNEEIYISNSKKVFKFSLN